MADSVQVVCFDEPHADEAPVDGLPGIEAWLASAALPFGYHTVSYTYAYSEFQSLIGDVALLYPPDYIAAIVAAGAARDFDRLDRLTDDLARMGYCRSRSDASLYKGDRPGPSVLASFTGWGA